MVATIAEATGVQLPFVCPIESGTLIRCGGKIGHRPSTDAWSGRTHRRTQILTASGRARTARLGCVV